MPNNLNQSAPQEQLNITLPNWLDDPDAFTDYINRSFALGLCLIVVGAIGIVANGISLYIFSRPTMRSSINILLAGLSAVDLVLLIFMVLVFGLPMIDTYIQSQFLYKFQPYSLKIFYPMNSITQTSSIWTLIAITVERWIAVRHPLKAISWCTKQRSKMSLVIIFCVSIGYNLVRFWEFDLSPDTPGGYRLLLKNTTAFPHYSTVYSVFFYLFTHFLFPFVLLVGLNSHVVWAIYKARQHRANLSRTEKNEHRTAIMMAVVILIFLLCNTLPLVLNFIENFVYPDFFKNERTFLIAYSLNDLSNLLMAVNSASSFAVYAAFSQKFWHRLLLMFSCCLPNRWSEGNSRTGTTWASTARRVSARPLTKSSFLNQNSGELQRSLTCRTNERPSSRDQFLKGPSHSVQTENCGILLRSVSMRQCARRWEQEKPRVDNSSASGFHQSIGSNVNYLAVPQEESELKVCKNAVFSRK